MRVCGKSPHVSAMLLKHVTFPSIERDGLVMHVNSDFVGPRYSEWLARSQEAISEACEWLGSDLWAHELLGVACE